LYVVPGPRSIGREPGYEIEAALLGAEVRLCVYDDELLHEIQRATPYGVRGTASHAPELFAVEFDDLRSRSGL